MSDIRFVFEGKRYTAPAAFYDTGLARLPDGRIVRPNTWLESLPPQPQGIAVVPVVDAAEAPPKPTSAA